MKPDQATVGRRKFAEELAPKLLAIYPDLRLVEAKEMTELYPTPEQLHGLAAWLQAQGFRLLLDIGGVDYLPRDPRFEVVYHFLAIPSLMRVRLRVAVNEGQELPTLGDLYAAATAAEREVFDLFGIRFSGHPNLTRIMLPDDWQGYPLRKDYPLRGPRGEEPGLPAEQNRFHPIKLDVGSR